MQDTLFPLLPFVPLFLFLLMHAFRARTCPQCGGPVYGVQSPFTKTRRQWIEGGYLCENCGLETDLNGNKIPPGTPVRRVAGAELALLSLGLLAGALGVSFLAQKSSPPPPPTVVAPTPAAPKS